MRTDGITFIVPNWNHELVLPRSIRSALQTGELLQEHGLRVEVLIIDDASRDGSPVLLRQLEALYYEQGVRVLSLARNIGVCAVRNLGLMHTTYRYAMVMDADNEVIPENVICFYHSIRDTEAAVVYGNLLAYELEGIKFYSHESFQTRMFADNYIDTFALVDVEQLLDVNGYGQDERRLPLEDWEMYLHLAACGRRLVHVPVLMALYYRTPLSLIFDANGKAAAAQLCQRVYYQFPEVRDRIPLATRHLSYHPAVGYL